MLRVVHKQQEEVKAKKVPLYKDRAFIEQLKRDIIRDHNKKINRLRAEGKL